MARVVAPWSLDQVHALNRYQRLGYVHEFTCPHEHGEPGKYVLRATPNGWHCPRCDYTQDWAHDFMADEARHPQNPIDVLKRTP